MERKFLFLLNPIAGNSNRSVIKKTIQKFIKDHKLTCEIHSTNPKGDYSAMRRKIVEENYTDVIVAGGDGTISSVVNDLRDTGVRFGLLPCGSGNGLALAAHIPKNTDRALQLISNGKARFTDAFLINNQFSCMLSGLGFDAQVAHEFAKQNKRGLITYIRQTFKHFISAPNYKFEIHSDDQKIETDAFFISIANSNQFGNQFTIAPKASLHDGLLDIVVVKKMNKLQILIAVLQQIRNGDVNEKIFNKNGILYFQTRSLRIKNPQNAPLHIDGDPAATSGEFTIRVIPSAFLLIKPD
ncbi:MAG: diacylglycerol kinase [Bacteroidetes bacterium]|nr:MAG: diacylglycerol kinase [Bacteroidota bacterium]